MSYARSAGGRRTPRINRPSLIALEGRTLLSGSTGVDLFAVPTISSGPGQIVDGPDGNLWFTEMSGKVGRITPQGQVAEFPLPTPVGGSLPTIAGLAAGSDGAMWALDVANAQVDRIGLDGQVQSFAIPGAPASGGGLTFPGVINTSPIAQGEGSSPAPTATSGSASPRPPPPSTPPARSSATPPASLGRSTGSRPRGS